MPALNSLDRRYSLESQADRTELKAFTGQSIIRRILGMRAGPTWWQEHVFAGMEKPIADGIGSNQMPAKLTLQCGDLMTIPNGKLAKANLRRSSRIPLSMRATS